MRKLIVAESAGFCFGVKRAVDMTYAALAEGEQCYCVGQIIHNNAVSEELRRRGLRVVDSIGDIPDGARIIIRSHGASSSEYAQLKGKNTRITDATCPKVSHIHRIVEREYAAGRQIIVIGMPEHPEVRAICTWCENALVFPEADDLEHWLISNPKIWDKPISVVFQTTQTKKKYDLCLEILKKLCTKCEIFDTICNATFLRQSEAESIAKKCDAMIVIGGKHSANSVHLFDICTEHCMNVSFIEGADELDPRTFVEADTIGITAGASAPAWIIKEVIQKMSNEIMDADMIEDTVNTEETAQDTGVTEAAEIQKDSEPENTVNNASDVTEAAPVAPDAVADGAESPDSAEVDQSALSGEEQEMPMAEPKPESEMTFAELLEDSFKTIANGETVSGVVAAITATEVSVDLGTKYSGYIPLSEFTDDTDVKLEDIIQVGSTIEASVVRVNDVEGTVMLSKRRLDAINNWRDIEIAQAEGTAVEGVVKEENKGGVVVTVSGIRVFVPASQTGLPKDVPMTDLVKQKVRLKITEVNRSRRRVVGSIRAVQAKERRERAEKIWNEIEVGKRYDGVVKSLTTYGAFVDIGGIDGMVHVSELSWSRIKQPSEVLSVGDKVEVYVISFDKDNKRISLGYKNPNANPWVMFTDQFKVGDITNVRVVKLMPFGAFAEVLPGVDGLIHISQIADRRIGKPDEVLTVGDYVDVMITNIDHDKQKISLSIRALLEPDSIPARAREADPEPESSDDALVYEVSADGTVAGSIPDADN